MLRGGATCSTSTDASTVRAAKAQWSPLWKAPPAGTAVKVTCTPSSRTSEAAAARVAAARVRRVEDARGKRGRERDRLIHVVDQLDLAHVAGLAGQLEEVVGDLHPVAGA